MDLQPIFELARQWVDRLDNYYVNDVVTDSWGWTSGDFENWNKNIKLDSGNPLTGNGYPLLWTPEMNHHSGPILWYASSAAETNTSLSGINGNIGFGYSLARGNSSQPAVRIVSPIELSPLSGLSTASAVAFSAADNSPIVRVEFLVDGAIVSQDTSSPFQGQWDTRAYLNGNHVLKAISIDAAGRSASDEIVVTVFNGLFGLTGPAISGSGNSRTFGVTYSHSSGTAPSYVRVVIPGQGTFDMAAVNPGDLNYADGKAYTYSRSFADGTYSYHFEAAAGGPPTGTSSQSFTVSTTASQLSLAATPNPVSEFSTTEVLATVRDAGGNVMAGRRVVFSTFFEGDFSGGNVAMNVSDTDANGVARVNFTPRASGNANVTATVQDSGLARTLSIGVNANTNIQISLGIAYQDGTATSSRYELNAFITQNGVPVPDGTAVSWTPAPTIGTLQNPEVFTQAGGAETDLITTQSGNAILSVTVSGTTKSISAFLHVGPPPAFGKFKTLPLVLPLESGGQTGWLASDNVLAVPNGNFVNFWNYATNTTYPSAFLTRAVNSGRSSPDGTKFLVGQSSGEFSVLAPDGSVLNNFDPGALFEINSASWVGDNTYFIGTRWTTQSTTNAIVSSRNSSGGEIRRFDVSAFWNATSGMGTVRSVAAYNGTPRMLAAGSHNGYLKVWNETGGELYAEANLSGQVPGDKICDMAFSPDGTRLVVVGEGFGWIYNTGVWGPSKQAIASLPVSETWSVCFVPLSTGLKFAVGRDDAKVSVYDMNGVLEKQATTSGRCAGVAWNPTYKILAASTEGGTDLFNLGDDFQGPVVNASAPSSVPFGTVSANLGGSISDPAGLENALIQVNADPPVSLLPLGVGGTFNVNATLAVGNNTIAISATDRLGNSTTLQLDLFRHPDTTPPSVSNFSTSSPPLMAGAAVILAVNATDFETGVASIQVLIQRPDENVVATVPLADDGLGPDLVAGDGFYSGVWDSTGQTEGAYWVDVVATDVAANAANVENAASFILNDLPVVSVLEHAPASPTDTQSVLISAAVNDSSGLGAVTALFSTGGPFSPVAMTFNPGTSRFEALLPPQSAGLVRYKVQAVDVLTNLLETGFQTYTVVDASPPVFYGLGLSPLNLTEDSLGALKVAALVLDPGGSGLAVPQIQFKRGTADAGFGAWQDMTFVSGKWEFDIPHPPGTWDAVRGQTLEYRMRASDVAGNMGSSGDLAELVDSINDVPVAAEGALSVTEDSSGGGTMGAVDADGDALSYAVATNGAKGTVTLLNAIAGTYSYVPQPNAYGTDVFTFTASDGLSTSLPVTITVTITPVNDSPLAVNGTLNVQEDVPQSGTLSAVEVDGQAVTFALGANGARGTAVITNPTTGAFTYTPAPGETGSDSFTFTASDGLSSSNVGTISVTILPTPVAPVITSTASTSAQWGRPYAYDVEATGTPAPTFSLLVAPSGMTIQTSSGVIAWTPMSSQSGSHTVSVRAQNGVEPAFTQTFTLAVSAPSLGVNDAFADAIVLSGFAESTAGSNAGAAKEAGEPNHAGQSGGASVWWVWVAPTTGRATIDTFGSSFNTVLAVYTGADLNTLVPLVSNDDSGGSQSEVTFATIAGVTYYIAVDGVAGASGDIQLHLSTTVAATDAFASAQILEGLGPRGEGTNVGATTEAGELSVGAGHSVWWRWVAPSSGSFTFSTAGSDFDTVMVAFTGGSVAALTEIARNDNAAGGDSTSSMTFEAVAGTTYAILVDGAGGATGTILLDVAPSPSPLPGGGGGGGGCGLTGVDALLLLWLVRRNGRRGRAYSRR